MKFRKIIQYLGIAVAALQWYSCDNRDAAEPVFKDSPPVRLSAQKKELNDALEDSEFGWKAVYFTDSLHMGGFTFLFRFKSGVVEMASDFDEDSNIHKSEYSIELGSTVSLVFSTRNKIHLLAQANNYPAPALKGQGYDGTFNFLYYGRDKDQIIFKTNRNFTELRFIKAKAEDWTNIHNNILMANNLKGDSKPIFRYLETSDGNKTNLYEFNFYSRTRFASTDRLDSPTISGYKGGIAYTPIGFTLHPPLKVGNQNLTEFFYDAATGNFNASGTNEVKASVKYSKKALLFTDDFMDFRNPLPLKMLYEYVMNPQDRQYLEYETPLFKNIYSKMFLKLKEQNIRLAGVYIMNKEPRHQDPYKTAIVYVCTDSRTEPAILAHFIDINEDSVNKKIIFSHKFWGIDATNPELITFLKKSVAEFDSYLMDPNGLYINKGQFTVQGYDAARRLDDIYTLTSVTFPFRMSFANQIQIGDVFNNQ